GQAPPAAPTAAPAACPDCLAPRSGRFCEACGHDFDAVPTQWTAVVQADRDYFDRVLALAGPDSSALAFPLYGPERSFPLAGEQVRIGRERGTEIDLDDPGVSHLHAVLLPRADHWVLVDTGSTNGTTLNDSDDELPVDTEVPVTDGDRIHVGAWTTIVLRNST
ncbi:MAG: FHA domain-containing protein, partial [Streptosporangiaceae bacterium]